MFKHCTISKYKATPSDINGRRFYVKGSIRQVKKLIGHLVRKIRLSAFGNVEVIHGYKNESMLTRKLRGLEWSSYDFR